MSNGLQNFTVSLSQSYFYYRAEIERGKVQLPNWGTRKGGNRVEDTGPMDRKKNHKKRA